MTWFGNGDDVIDFNDAGDVARIDTIIRNNGAFDINGTPIQLTTPELASLIAIRQNAPALDSLGEAGFNNGDGKVGSADYNHAIGEGREAAEDVTGRAGVYFYFLRSSYKPTNFWKRCRQSRTNAGSIRESTKPS